MALGVVAADAATKWWARHALADRSVHVFGPLRWHLEYNSGISFSINRLSPMVTTVITAVVALVVVVVGLRARRGLATVGFGLLIGGGVGNLVDRLAARPHRVTDFIAVSSFPVFNLADAAITVGFVLLAVAAFRGGGLVSG